MEERSMLDAINKIRMDPAGYREEVERAFEAVLMDSASYKGEISETVITRWVVLDAGTVVQRDTIRRDRFNQLCEAYQDLLIDLANCQPLQPLDHSPELLQVAKEHARNNSQDEYLDHQGRDGTLPADRIMAAIPWAKEGNENIAAGPGNEDAILMQLMVDSGVDNRGHRKNLLDPDWTYMACYRVDAISSSEITWWIQEFAR